MQNLRRLVAGALVAFCLVVGAARAQSPYSIYVDGAEMQFTAGLQPVEINNSVLLPMRDLFERLGAKVVWDEGSQRVFAVKDKLVMILPIDNDYAYFNGRSVRMGARAQLIDERTYVPLRFVSTIFGAGVYYDPSTKRIDITVMPKKLSAEGQARLAALSEAVNATGQVASFTGGLSGLYTVSLGDDSVPVGIKASMAVGGPDRLAFDYSLSSSTQPDNRVQGQVVAISDKLYIKAPGQEWVAQPVANPSSGNSMVAGLLAGLTGGNVQTLPLGDMFGEIMLPTREALAKMYEQGLIAGLDDLGSKEKDGRQLQGYRLTVDPVRFAYYYSNLGGADPKAQGQVLDNVQSLGLSSEYWVSPEDHVVYASSIDLSLAMKSYAEAPEAARFTLTLTEQLTSVNQPVEITPPVSATN